VRIAADSAGETIFGIGLMVSGILVFVGALLRLLGRGRSLSSESWDQRPSFYIFVMSVSGVIVVAVVWNLLS
jgi:hypothetical protein